MGWSMESFGRVGPGLFGVMTDANEAVAPVHNRMPVLLHRDEHDQWLRGDFEEALAFQSRVFPSDLIHMERTPELWVKKKNVEGGHSTML